jgi:hypothetical protein
VYGRCRISVIAKRAFQVLVAMLWRCNDDGKAHLISQCPLALSPTARRTNQRFSVVVVQHVSTAWQMGPKGTIAISNGSAVSRRLSIPLCPKHVEVLPPTKRSMLQHRDEGSPIALGQVGTTMHTVPIFPSEKLNGLYVSLLL